MDDESIAQVMEETALTKIRLKLNEQKVKLWEPPYYDPEKRSVDESQLHELAMTLKVDLNMPVPLLFQGLQMLQQNALEKIAARDKFKESGVLSLRIRYTKGLDSRFKTMNVDAKENGKFLLDKIASVVGKKPDALQLISGGKVIQMDSPLQDQGVKTSSVVMVVQITDRDSLDVVAEQRKLLEQTKEDARRLGERTAADDYSLQIADQSGRSLELPPEEKKSLIIAMSLHEKGRAALHNKDYALALILLLEAESEFNSCRSELVASVDNFAILDLDVAWCYLMLQAVGELPNADARLERCEKKFIESYGADLERLALIKGATGKEAALLMRLHLLQGIVAFHLGREREAELLLKKTKIESQLLEVKEEALIQLQNLGYTPAEARLGLRACQGNIQAAADHIERKREERVEIRRKEEEKKEITKLRNKLGKCEDGSWVNVGYYKSLLNMGFTSKVAEAALKQANNGMSMAVQLLQEEPEFIQMAAEEAGKNVNEEDLVRLVSLGYSTDAAKIALKNTDGNVEEAAELLLLNDGKVEDKADTTSKEADKMAKSVAKRLKEDKEAFNRIKDDIAKDEEDHLDLDLKLELEYLEKYNKLVAERRSN